MKQMKKFLFALFLFAPSFGHCLTQGTLRAQIRLLIKDTDSTRTRYTDAQLNTLENEAQRDINNSAWLVEKSTSIALVSGTTYYSTPSDLIEILRVTREYKLLNETTFDKADSDAAGSSWESSSGVPLDYFQDSTQPDKFGLKPFPVGTSSTGTIRMQYVAQPVDLSSDSDIPFNSYNRYLPYHDLIAYYVATRIFMIEGDQTKTTFYGQLYESRVQMLKDKVKSIPNYLPGFGGSRTGK